MLIIILELYVKYLFNFEKSTWNSYNNSVKFYIYAIWCGPFTFTFTYEHKFKLSVNKEKSKEQFKLRTIKKSILMLIN